MPLPTLDALPVCILSNIASFVNQQTFSEFVCLSRSNRDAHLLPTNISFATPTKISPFRKWHNLHRSVAIVLTQIHLQLVIFDAKDSGLEECSSINFVKLQIRVFDNSFKGHVFHQYLVSQSLTELSILGARGLVDDALIYISRLPLTSLEITEASRITGNGVKHLVALHLTFLGFRGCIRLSNDGIAHLAHMPLTKLDLSDCDDLTDMALTHLSKCPLTSLNLSFCKFRDTGISYLSQMPITELNLRGCSNITDLALTRITQLPLYKLDVSDCRSITSEAVVRTLQLTDVSERSCDRRFKNCLL